ncbi:ABC transporter ATP-binding protein [Nonomuraea sp. NPDC049655]|uniref:ABC transporter ATP-binding protein n=1 Tax=Nonomuraea sp. NPDC049655 TaxID=3364355 RepID=UPI00378ADA42
MNVGHRHGDRLIAWTARATWAPLAGTAVAAAASIAVSLALPSAVGAAVNAVLAGTGSTAAYAELAVLLLAAALADVVSGVAGITSVAAATRLLRLRAIDRVLRTDAAGAGAFPAGELVNRLVGNTATTGYVPATLLQIASGLVLSAGGVVALFTIDWRVGVAFLSGVPVALVVMRVFVARVSGLYGDYQRAQGRLAARLAETLAGIRTVRAAGTADREIARVLRPLPELSAAGHALWRAQAQSVWRITLILPLVEVVVLAVAGLGVAQGRLPAGALPATAGHTALGLVFVEQIDPLLGMAFGRSAAVRVHDVLALPVPAAGTRPLPPGPGTLSFRGVTVRRGQAPLLDGVDLEIPAGVMTAVVGGSGAGKTTLALLAGRLADPDDGQVLLDGVPLRDVDPGPLRDAVAYAFERPMLLGGDIAGVISYGAPACAPEAVRAAAKAAAVHDVIRRLPFGYATPAADAPLSGGEVQRLGLARAFLRQARVTVLDDATSSLDTATEARVSRALAEGMRGRTRLVIAHRPATAALADLVVWLDAGRVRGRGTHQELWRDPAYRALFAAAEHADTPRRDEEDTWTSAR